MPNLEIFHYIFDKQITYCGYSLERCPNVTDLLNKVTCLKCINLIKSSRQGSVIRRKNRSITRKLHLQLRKLSETEFKAECGRVLPLSDNLNISSLKICRRCVQSRKARLKSVK